MIVRIAKYFTLFALVACVSWFFGMYFAFGNEFFGTVFQDFIKFLKTAVFAIIVLFCVSVSLAIKDNKKS